MTFEIKDYFETPVILEPRVELYTVYDFMGKELPGLAIVLDMPIQGADEKEQFAILTKSFEEFIGLKNSAYVDINNCPFAPQLLNRGFAKDTGLYKESGFCSYPLWTFDETVPFPVSWTVKMKKKQKETQDILSYHSQAAGCSDKARAKASGGRQPIEECGRTGL